MSGTTPVVHDHVEAECGTPNPVVAPINAALDAEYRSTSQWSDAGLYDLWRASVPARPAQEAVIDSRGFRATYADVDDQASRLAATLREAGVGRGDVVSVVMPNWGEFLVVNVACMKLGAILCPSLPQHRFSELRYQFGRCATAALVVASRFHSIDHLADAQRLSQACPQLRAVITVGEESSAQGRFTTFEQALQHDRLPEEECTPGGGNDVVAVLFTSGSEAQPKGVMLTHNNVLASERSFIEALALQPGVRMFMPAPLAHATGYLHGVVMPMMVGGCTILLDSFKGAEAAKLINAHLATCTMGSTTIIRDLLDAGQQIGGFHGGLRRICCGGAPVPRTLVERALEMGIAIHSVYGATESAPHTMTRPGDPLELVVRTDGRAVPGTQVRIVNPRTRATLPSGCEGEEASRGPAVFAGYLGDPERSAAVLDNDGWYYSGDLAVMDEAGYIRVTGRIKDTILRGGENISAREVEELMFQHPAVRDVAVVGMPNPRLGECACAFVVLRQGAQPLSLAGVRAFFELMEVAKFKIPERIEIVDALPLTPTGKVRKVELRARIATIVANENACECDRDRR